MSEYLETKRTVTNNLIIGTALGSAVGLFYLPYILLRLSAAKRAAGTAKGA